MSEVSRGQVLNFKYTDDPSREPRHFSGMVYTKCGDSPLVTISGIWRFPRINRIEANGIGVPDGFGGTDWGVKIDFYFDDDIDANSNPDISVHIWQRDAQGYDRNWPIHLVNMHSPTWLLKMHHMTIISGALVGDR